MENKVPQLDILTGFSQIWDNKLDTFSAMAANNILGAAEVKTDLVKLPKRILPLMKAISMVLT